MLKSEVTLMVRLFAIVIATYRYKKIGKQNNNIT